MARILIATDAWHPQINGVVRTLDSTIRFLRNWGHCVEVVEPSAFPSLPIPFYPEIRVSFPLPRQIDRRLKQFQPDYVHIATEGPIGLLVRRACRLFDWRFTTSYHTKFPEYLQQMTGIPARGSYQFLKWFHGGASATMVSTNSLERELTLRGFQCTFRRWLRGVDLSLFQIRPKRDVPYSRPVMLYVGRVSKEKNLVAFLSLDVKGTKVVVGDGPALSFLKAKYPAVQFLGVKHGNELAEIYSNADLFVFPSRTDTFGIVLIEALASGLPIAAYPVTGPIDIVNQPEIGILDDDLHAAVKKALAVCQPLACAEEGQTYTWERCGRQFLDNLVRVK